MIEHFINDSATAEWLAMCRADEAEESRSPAQQPRAVKRVVSLDFASGCTDGFAFDERTPAFLRRQAS